MPDEENGTLNTEPGDSSISGPDFGDLMPTIELAAIQGKGAGQDGGGKDDASQDDVGKTKEQEAAKASGEDDRLDKHPRFQELIKDRNELRETIAELRGAVQTLQGQFTGKGGSQGSQGAEGDDGDLSFQDLSQMDDDALVTMISEQPRSFLGNFTRQLFVELGEKIEQRVLGALESRSKTQTIEQRINQTYQDFEEKNPDFGKMWDSGEIKKFMDATPGHNAISAYHALRSSTQETDVQKRIDEAVSKALKNAQAGKRADLTAKHNAQVLGSGPVAGVTTDTLPSELKDTKKFGGSLRVLAQRSAARMSQRGG